MKSAHEQKMQLKIKKMKLPGFPLSLANACDLTNALEDDFAHSSVEGTMEESKTVMKLSFSFGYLAAKS